MTQTKQPPINPERFIQHRRDRWPRPFEHALSERLKGVPLMVNSSIPHFHNDLGVPSIKVGVTEFMCTGTRPPFDHPHIFLDMGSDIEALCPYCSTHFVYNSNLSGPCSPAECELRDLA